jgi:hypothetical protein
MFDLLTLDDLYEFITQLGAEHGRVHDVLMDDATGQLNVSVMSQQWAVLNTRQAETYETMTAVQAEITRREAGGHVDA